jgi:hypothetical protein
MIVNRKCVLLVVLVRSLDSYVSLCTQPNTFSFRFFLGGIGTLAEHNALSDSVSEFQFSVSEAIDRF